MLIKRLHGCKEFIAGDGSNLREFLNPLKEELNLRYSLAHAVLKPGQVTQPHKLKSSEVYYILEGKGLMHIDDESKEVVAGSTIYIPPNSKQYIENVCDGDLKFLSIVDPAWKLEDEEVL